MAISDGVKVFDSPDFLSRQLTSPKKYEVLTVLGTEQGPGRVYWKVNYGNTEGFLEQDGYGFDVFTPGEANSLAMVTTASLRVRQAPSTSNEARVLFSIKRGDIVKVLARGKRSEVMEDRLNVWYQIESQGGKKGFCFGNYITPGTRESLMALRNAKIEPCSGWIRVKGDPRFTSSPGKDAPEVTESDPARCNHDLSRYPKKGECAPVVEKATIGTDLFYRVEDTFKDFLECTGSINGWISAKHVDHLTDFFVYSKEKSGSQYDAEMLSMLNAKIGGSLNVSSLKMEKVSLSAGESGTEFYIVKAYRGPRKPFHVFFLSKHGTAYTTLLYIPGGGQERNQEWEPEPKLVDLDRDGTKEIFVPYPAVDSEYRYSLYTLAGNGCREVFSINSIGQQGHYIRDSFLVFFPDKFNDGSFMGKMPFDNGFNGKKIRVLKYENSSLHEIDPSSTGLNYQTLQKSDELIAFE